MPRPVVEQKVVTAPVNVGQEQAPQLGVYAPIQGVHAPQQSNLFGSLANALGMVAPAAEPMIKQAEENKQKTDTAAGEADAELGQVDADRLAHSHAYATAVHAITVQKQYLNAEAATSEWAATNVDKTLPFGDQTKAIDAHMQSQLGVLAKDPKAAAIIAPLYTKFINRQANDIVAQQVQAKQNEAIDTVKGTVMQSLQNGGDGDYVGQVAMLTPILGDRTEAVKAVTQMYVDHATDVAAQGGDWKHVYDSLPTDITLKDGTKIPGPGRSPALHDYIMRGKADAQKAYNNFMEPQRAKQQLSLFTHFDELAHNGSMLTTKMMEPYTQPGPNGEKPLLTPEQAASYIDRARDKREKDARDAAGRTNLLNPNWQSMVGQIDPTDPKGKRVLTKDDFQHWFDQKYMQGTQGQDQNTAISAAISATKAYHLPVTSLKLNLEGAVNVRDPQAALKMLPAYQQLKAAGETAMYLNADQQTFYENLEIRKQTGANDDDIVKAASRYDPKEAATLTDPHTMQAARDALHSQKLDGTGWFGSSFRADTLSGFANTRMFDRESDRLLRKALVDNGGNATAAAQVVAKTLNDQWMPVDLNGQKVLLPRVGRTKDGARMVYDQQVLEHTLSVMSTEEAPKLAKQAGASNYQTAQFRIVAMPGGDTEVEVTDDVGNPIPGTARVPFTDLYKHIEAKYHDDAYKQAAAVKADAEYRRSHPKSTVLMGQAGRGA